jgi:ferredoxin
MQDISFNDIKNLFDDTWDVGVITSQDLHRISLMPIKQKAHLFGADFTNDIHYEGLTNTIILVKQGQTWDYTHYEEACILLKNSGIENWFPIYTNFKEAVIQAGLGVRARNSLVYSYKFGFDCHISAIGFEQTIVDWPTDKRVNRQLWKRCSGCDDCIKACPVNAIHGLEEPYWLDSGACDNFIGMGNHPTIPSIKKFWGDNVYPGFPKEVLYNIKSYTDTKKIFGDWFPFNKNGYSFDGQVMRHNGEAINIPFCRECTSQPRCSKWGGKFPYDKVIPINVE